MLFARDSANNFPVAHRPSWLGAGNRIAFEVPRTLLPLRQIPPTDGAPLNRDEPGPSLL